MRFELARLAEVLGQSIDRSRAVSGYSIDTRTLEPGDLFFALRGDTSDGHQYVAQALEKGAAAAVTDRDVPGLPDDAVLIRTPDVLDALQRLATWARKEWGGPLIGVTGSAGKTTTKDVVSALLESELRTGKTTGNYNNHIGLPLSLLRVPGDAQVAVIEMGMNHAGEIRALALLARPDVAVVTNAGYAHIENFESIEGVALAKRELVEALPADGTAVLNADDSRVTRFGEIHPGRTVRFGVSPDADIRAEDVVLGDKGIQFRVGDVAFESALSGMHSVRNILAGIAVAGLFDIAPEKLRDKVSELAPGKMRGERLQHNGITIFNDCYNSNPDAAKHMLDLLRDTPAQRRIAVLGEMLELGRWAEPLHRDVGTYAARCGISVLIGIRGAAQFLVDAAIEAGLAVDAAYFFPDPAEAGAALKQLAQPGDAILFKGSRGTHVEKALEEFLH